MNITITRPWATLKFNGVYFGPTRNNPSKFYPNQIIFERVILFNVFIFAQVIALTCFIVRFLDFKYFGQLGVDYVHSN